MDFFGIGGGLVATDFNTAVLKMNFANSVRRKDLSTVIKHDVSVESPNHMEGSNLSGNYLSDNP